MTQQGFETRGHENISRGPRATRPGRRRMPPWSTPHKSPGSTRVSTRTHKGRGRVPTLDRGFLNAFKKRPESTKIPPAKEQRSATWPLLVSGNNLETNVRIALDGALGIMAAYREFGPRSSPRPLPVRTSSPSACSVPSTSDCGARWCRPAGRCRRWPSVRVCPGGSGWSNAGHFVLGMRHLRRSRAQLPAHRGPRPGGRTPGRALAHAGGPQHSR